MTSNCQFAKTGVVRELSAGTNGIAACGKRVGYQTSVRIAVIVSRVCTTVVVGIHTLAIKCIAVTFDQGVLDTDSGYTASDIVTLRSVIDFGTVLDGRPCIFDFSFGTLGHCFANLFSLFA